MDPQNFVFLDESGIQLEMLPIYLRSKRGSRAFLRQRYYKSKSYTLVAAVTGSKVIAPFMFEGAMTTKIFQIYVEKVLLKELKPEQVVIMDNLSSHKSTEIKRLIENKGAKLIFLPPYSPELNPIELAWSKLKACLRNRRTLSDENLVKAVRVGLNKITKSNCRNWFRHCGYLIQ